VRTSRSLGTHRSPRISALPDAPSRAAVAQRVHLTPGVYFQVEAASMSLRASLTTGLGSVASCFLRSARLARFWARRALSRAFRSAIQPSLELDSQTVRLRGHRCKLVSLCLAGPARLTWVGFLPLPAAVRCFAAET
jgi:hypothetical protein